MSEPADSYGFQERVYDNTLPRLFIITPKGDTQRNGPPGFFGWRRCDQLEYLAQFDGWEACASGRPDGFTIYNPAK